MANRTALALKHRIERRYPTVTDRVRFGDVTFDFTRVADPNRVLDEVAAEEDRRERTTGQRHGEPLHLPYWAELWDSGGGVAAFVVHRYPVELAGRSVLDLGCGQGLLGCVAAALGARVTFADLEAPALLFAQLNAWPFNRNVYVPRPVERRRRRFARRRRVFSIATRRIDWQTDRLTRRFDLILGADILYDRTQWQHLEPFWRHHLGPGGRVLLGEPGRPTGGMFLDWLRDKGWTLAEFEQPVPTRDRPIRVFDLRVEDGGK